MFGSGQPPGWAHVLPGYGAERLVISGGFATGFHAWSDLALTLGWIALLGVAVRTVLARLLGVTAANAFQPPITTANP